MGTQNLGLPDTHIRPPILILIFFIPNFLSLHPDKTQKFSLLSSHFSELELGFHRSNSKNPNSKIFQTQATTAPRIYLLPLLLQSVSHSNSCVTRKAVTLSLSLRHQVRSKDTSHQVTIECCIYHLFSCIVHQTCQQELVFT